MIFSWTLCWVPCRAAEGTSASRSQQPPIRREEKLVCDSFVTLGMVPPALGPISPLMRKLRKPALASPLVLRPFKLPLRGGSFQRLKMGCLLVLIVHVCVFTPCCACGDQSITFPLCPPFPSGQVCKPQKVHCDSALNLLGRISRSTWV